jgi:hypothetical protein
MVEEGRVSGLIHEVVPDAVRGLHSDAPSSLAPRTTVCSLRRTPTGIRSSLGPPEGSTRAGAAKGGAACRRPDHGGQRERAPKHGRSVPHREAYRGLPGATSPGRSSREGGDEFVLGGRGAACLEELAASAGKLTVPRRPRGLYFRETREGPLNLGDCECTRIGELVRRVAFRAEVPEDVAHVGDAGGGDLGEAGRGEVLHRSSLQVKRAGTGARGAIGGTWGRDESGQGRRSLARGGLAGRGRRRRHPWPATGRRRSG